MRKVALFLRNLVLVGLFAFLAIYFLHDQFASDLPVASPESPDATLVAVSVPPALAADNLTPTPSPVPLPTPTPAPFPVLTPTPTPRITAVPTPTPTPAPTPTTAPTPTPAPTASLGDQGSVVTMVQRRLQRLGYFKDEIDGKYGKSTVAAVAAFQQDNHLSSHGNVDEATYRVLYSASFSQIVKPTAKDGATVPRFTVKPTATLCPTANPGDRGELVKSIQRKLTSLGYLQDKVDGIYGNKTAQAVMAFQRFHGLADTGAVDSATYAAMFLASAASAPVVRATAKPAATPTVKPAAPQRAASGGTGQDYRAQASAGTRYVLNTNTGKFHKASCHHVKKIKPSNYREYTGTRDAVIGMGYVPCKVCNP